jgi:uncharacterized protein
MKVKKNELDFIYAEKLLHRKKPDTIKAYEIIARLADVEFAPAQYALATWYIHGFDKIIKPNIKKAIGLLKKSASQNYPSACYDLAYAYESGQGVAASMQKAIQFYTKAALLGDVQAMGELARINYYGVGIEKNRGLGLIWLDEKMRLSK